MKTQNIDYKWIGARLRHAEKWAIANPGKEYRKTVIHERWNDMEIVSRWMYEENYLESEYVGELFAIKENGKAVYSSFSTD